jgi:transposase
MTTLTDHPRPVTGGVDTHRDEHVAVVVDHLGRVLGTEAFPADAKGYAELVAFMRGFGPLGTVGVEGTGCYGAGLLRHLAAEGVEVAEVVRPNRQQRRRRGKSDPADAEAAARAVLAGEACGAPKSRDGKVESVRALLVARRGAVKARTQAANQLRDLVISAPEPLRARLLPLSSTDRAELAARFRPGRLTDPAEAAKAAMRAVAKRYLVLGAEMDELERTVDELVRAVLPERFMVERGIGPLVAAVLLVAAGDNPGRLRSEASFAALCGVSPVDASSGQQRRHRLNRGGDRQANSALWRIVMTRLACDQRTREYVARRTAEGRTTREAVRCLKRYVARQVYRELVGALGPSARESQATAA